jgi:hypothetical protein
MPTLALPIASLVRDNASVLMTFVYSRRHLEDLVKNRYVGEWGLIRETLLNLPQVRAERACLELALLLRYLDDEKALSAFAKEHANYCFGFLYRAGAAYSEPIFLRDVSNKIIHARSLSWEFQKEDRPLLVAHPRDSEKWQRAEIDVLNVVSVCGNLADHWGAA